MKFTYKKEKKETGLRAVGYPNPSTVIKLEGKQVGLIAGPYWNSKDNLWRISFCVRDSVDSSGFKWITLKTRFPNEPEAREFIEENADHIANLGLHRLDIDDE